MLLAIGLLYFLVNTHLASYSNLHEVMNEEELKHYFGTSDTSDLQDAYDVALLRKVKDDNLLTRYLKNEADSVEDYVVAYINRLSDLFFTMARAEMDKKGVAEEKWQL